MKGVYMRVVCFFVLLTAIGAAVAAESLPKDVSSFIAQREACDHCAVNMVMMRKDRRILMQLFAKRVQGRMNGLSISSKNIRAKKRFSAN